MQSKISKILLYLIYVFIILAECFAFYKTQLYFYLFNTGNWKMAAENVVISYLEYTGITAAVCGIYHLVKKWLEIYLQCVECFVSILLQAIIL